MNDDQTDDPGLLRERETARRIALAVLHREDLAEDAVQDACLAALRSEETHRHPRGWIFRVTRRRALDILRRESRRRRREMRVARPERQRDESVRVDDAEAAGHVLAEVRRLPPHYRDAILLRYLDGLSPAEIAEREGLPIETIRTRLKRARRALRDRLDRDGGAGAAVAAVLLREPRRPAGLLRRLPLALGGVAAALLLALPLGFAWTSRPGPSGSAEARAAARDEGPVPEPARAEREGRGTASAPAPVRPAEAAGRSGAGLAAARDGVEWTANGAGGAARHRHRLLTLDAFGSPGERASAPGRKWHGVAVEKEREALPDGSLRLSFSIYFDPPGRKPLDVAEFHAGETEVLAEMDGTLELRARPAGKGKYELEILAYDLDTDPIPLTLPPFTTGKNHLHLDPAALSRGFADEEEGRTTMLLRGNLSNDIFSKERPLPFSLEVATDWAPGQEVFEFRVAAHIDSGRLLGGKPETADTGRPRRSPR